MSSLLHINYIASHVSWPFLMNKETSLQSNFVTLQHTSSTRTVKAHSFGLKGKPAGFRNCVESLTSSSLFETPIRKPPLKEFQYFVVIDFEATCDKEKNPNPQEIIEFPSVIVNCATRKLESHFQTYVRPSSSQILSQFCKDLTGIQQHQVDEGVPLCEALRRHDQWLEEKGIKETKFGVVTWSDWDCRWLLEPECRFKNIARPRYFNRWVNLKVASREAFKGARCNLKDAVEMAGLVWEGRTHCGIDDAKNTARLLCFLLEKGVRVSFTSSLRSQTNDSVNRKQKSWLA